MTNLLLPAEPKAMDIHPGETALVIIDMQKDFLYHDGFGEFLGNDVTLLQRAIEPTRQVLAAWRAGANGHSHPRGPFARYDRLPHQ